MSDRDGGPDVGPARQETIRYHQELYAQPADDVRGNWLARPHRLVVESLTAVSGPLHAYDLGAGAGRHALFLARELPAGSRVTAVDLLPAALDRLSADAARAGVSRLVDVVRADLEDYRFPADDAGLVVAFSVLEHLRSTAAIVGLLDRCRRATRPGGVHAVAVFADRHEVTTSGIRPALVECPLTGDEARALLAHAYGGWEVLAAKTSRASARETRNGESYELRSTLVALLARASDQRSGPKLSDCQTVVVRQS